MPEYQVQNFRDLLEVIDFLKVPTADALLMPVNPRRILPFITGEILGDESTGKVTNFDLKCPYNNFMTTCEFITSGHNITYTGK